MAEQPTGAHARNRLTFLLALVPYLIDRERISVSAVAEHFGVPAEQIRDAVRLIAVSGIPGETNQYQPGDLFDIAWDDFEDNDQIVLTHLVALDDSPRFSGREAAALIAGLQYLSALPESADRAAMATLTDKLSRGASANPSAVAVEGSDSDETLVLIRRAVTAGKQVEFDYLGARGTLERRRVDPLRIESADANWYLRGWCHLREAVRTFRLDRIGALTVRTEPVTDRARGVALPETLFERSAGDLAVSLDVAVAALPLLADYRPENTDIRAESGGGATEGEWIRVTIPVAHYHGLKRLVAGMAGVVRVVQPAEARRTVADWAAAGAARDGSDR